MLVIMISDLDGRYPKRPKENVLEIQKRKLKFKKEKK